MSKHIEVDDGIGKSTKPVSYILLSSIFREKNDYPTCKTWKALSEAQKEDSESTEAKILGVSENKFTIKYEISDKHRSSNQLLDLDKPKLSDNKRKVF